MYFSRVITTLFSLAISLNSVAQLTESEVREMVRNSSESQLVNQCSQLTQEGYLFYAEIASDRLLEINPESSNYNYRKGFLMLDIRKDYVGAIPYLEKAKLDVDQNYDLYSHKEKSAAIDAIYHLAQCYHFNEEIGKALENYELFVETTNKKSELLPIANLKIEQCKEAIKQMANPVNVYLTNIGDAINTNMPEYSPVISLDGSALYFTSRRAWENNETESFKDPRINQYPEDVYVSYMDFDSTWTEPMRLDFCQPRQNEATLAISSDERKIYIYQDSTGNGDIYFTDFYHAKFRDIQKLEMNNVNSRYWETHAMMSHRKDLFFFVSDRPGGYGGRDIYMVKLKANGKWGSPINLGPNVNGSNDDDAPFIAVDNQTLYFATNDSRSIGGFDIMRTQLQEDGSWSKATNLGYPFNSTNDDIFYTTTLDGGKGYMTSFRKDGKGEKDIYEIHNDFLGMKDVAVLRGLIKTVDDKPIPEDFAINIKLVCLDCNESGINRYIFPRLRDGVFMTGLDPCKTYRLEYTNLSDNKTMGDDTFTTFCDTNYQEILRELLLDVDTRELIFPPDTIIELPPVTNYVNLEFMHYFSYNKNKLTTKKGELKDFVKSVEEQLRNGRETITINVYSSASKVPTNTYLTNERLTEIRAENMKSDITAYFEKHTEYTDRVNVVIVSKLVQGPAYEKDAVKKDKYTPYQYVGLKTK